MQKWISFILFVGFFVAGCSSTAPKTTESKSIVLGREMSHFVGQMNTTNCQTSIPAFRNFVRSVDITKNNLDSVLQNSLFQTRLQIKNVFSEGIRAGTDKGCASLAKLALSDVRALEEALGMAQLPRPSERSVSSVVAPSMFTDSHRQMVTNPQSLEPVRSLLDLKTGDILLLHRVVLEDSSQDVSPLAGDWTDIVVVYKDEVEDLYLLTSTGTQIKRRGWYQMGDWLKRSVDRVQVLRPESTKNLSAQVARLQNRHIKTPYAFGSLIKKELNLKTSTTIVASGGESVLGDDLEMSPDLTILSEWKDFTFAFKSKMLTILPQQTHLEEAVITLGVTSH